MKCAPGKRKKARAHKGKNSKFVTKETFPISCLTQGDNKFKKSWSGPEDETQGDKFQDQLLQKP